MKISLKDYKRKYQKECCKMAEQTWAFPHLLYGRCNKKILFKGFFESYLTQSHYRKVAINEDGEILGYLLGKNRQKKSFTLWLQNIFMKIKYLFHILIGNFGERKRIFQLLKLQDKAYEAVIPLGEEFDAEIELFFVHKEARGLGIGRDLLEDFLNNYCKNNQLKNVVLFTDESSTYEFYDKYGFKRYKTTEYSKTLREVQGKRAFSYILSLKHHQ